MFDIPEIMRMAQSMARHASARQGVIADNVAHADTPGFRARDLPKFGAAYAQSASLVSTRPGHLDASQSRLDIRAFADPSSPSTSPNGNTVSLEREMMRIAETRQSHDMALAVYGSARTILRSSLGR